MTTASATPCQQNRAVPSFANDVALNKRLHDSARKLEAIWQDKPRLELAPPIIEAMADDPPASFSPDGSLLAVGTGKDIRLWSAADQSGGAEQVRLQGHTAAVEGLVWNSNGSILETISEGGDPLRVRIWSTDGRCLAKLAVPEPDATAFSPDGSQFAWVEFGGDAKAGHPPLVLRISDLSFANSKAVQLAADYGTASPQQHLARLAFSPDSKTIAVTLPTAKENSLRVIDASSGRVVAALPCLDLDYYDEPIAFSQDGQYMVWVADQQHLGMFDVAKQRQVLSADDKRCVPRAKYVINHAGTEVASNSIDKSICIWKTSTGALARVLARTAETKTKGHAAKILRRPRAWTSDDRGLLSQEDFLMTLLDSKTGRRVPFPKVDGVEAIPRADNPTPEGVAAPDGTLATVSRHANMAWFFGSKLAVRAVKLSEMYNSNREVMAISGDGKMVVAAGLPTQVLSLETGEQLATLENTDGVSFGSLMFHPSAPLIYGIGPTGPKAWNLDTGSLATEAATAPDEVHYLEFGHNDHSLIAAIGASLRVWNLTSGEPGGELASNAFTSDETGSEIIVPTGTETSIQINRWHRLKVKSGTVPTRLPLCETLNGEGSVIRRSSQVPLLAVAQREHVVICDLITGQIKKTLDERTQGATRLALSPQGHRLALAARRAPFVLDLQRNKRIELAHAKEPTALEFLSEARVVANDFRSPRIRVWDSTTGTELASFDVAKDKVVTMLATSDDGQYLATTVDEPSVSVWQANGALHASLASPAVPTAMAFSKDGRFLAVGSTGLVTLYDLRSKKRIADLGQKGYPPGAFVLSPTGGLQIFGDQKAADENLRCHVGPARLPLQACAERLTTDNLLCPLLQ